MYNPRENRILNFFHGEDDLRNRVLRHTSPAFPEDPLRVLRGMQFASRFNLIAAPETVTLAREIKASHWELPRERIREEWFKWAAKSETPSLGLRFLNETEWIEFYPELAAIRGVPQDSGTLKAMFLHIPCTFVMRWPHFHNGEHCRKISAQSSCWPL